MEPDDPNYLRGRMASIEMISYLTGPMLGAQRWNRRRTLGRKGCAYLRGILCVVSVLGAAVFLPKFLTYDGREGVKQKEIEEAERAEMLRVSESEF